MTQGICPSSTGAKDVIPSAFSPRTGLLYIPAHNTCMDYEGIEANYIAGTPYLGADVKMYPGPGGYQGELVAWDVAHNRKAWGVKEEKFPVYSGVLATGGDVVFYGTMDGWFKAADARTGTELWKFHVSSGIVANPITYLGPDGKQYVAVYSGIGGWMGAVAFPDMSADDPYAGTGRRRCDEGHQEVHSGRKHRLCLRSVGRSRSSVRPAPCLGAAVPSPQPLRVCADPNNLPFSNQRRDGFENKIAALVASELHRPLEYFWLPQRRGFIRNSLNAGRCEVVIGVPAHYGLLQPTRSYYRSSYAFVSRRDRHLHIDSFDNGRVESVDHRHPGQWRRLQQSAGGPGTGGAAHHPERPRIPDLRRLLPPDPQREIVDAVADGRVDVAIVWGPLAGYYATREPTPLAVTPIATERDGPVSALAFDIAMGVRRDDRALKTALDEVIARRGSTMRQILRSYGVPLR